VKDTVRDHPWQTFLYLIKHAALHLAPNLLCSSTRCFLKKWRYRTPSKQENSVLQLNHVTDVTIVLNETAASDGVSRS